MERPYGYVTTLLVFLTGADLRYFIVVAALERYPVRFDVLAGRQEIGPRIASD
jgi:hypothetical protein